MVNKDLHRLAGSLGAAQRFGLAGLIDGGQPDDIAGAGNQSNALRARVIRLPKIQGRVGPILQVLPSAAGFKRQSLGIIQCITGKGEDQLAIRAAMVSMMLRMVPTA